ncbi:MAG TPA: guanine deaminase [Haloplasmataceae bacterium]
MSCLYAVKGNIIYACEFGSLETVKNGYIVVNDNKVLGVYPKLPDEYQNIEIRDYNDHLIIPGFVDLHVHAPQFSNIGLGLDKELLPWLDAYTFPEEAKFKDIEYACKVYSAFIHELWKYGTTRACVFGTIHKESTMALMDLFHEAGLGAYVGKVNMDRNAPSFLIETTEVSLQDTEEILMKYVNKYDLVKPIITPRFIPSCTNELLKGLGQLAQKYQVSCQSHLCENFGEISYVKELHPDASSYASLYDEAGLFGDVPTIMAHCVLVDEDEIELMKQKQVFVAHNPISNCNLRSGIAPIRRLIKRGIPVGLGSDVSGGHTVSMMDVMVNCSQVANLKWIYSDRIDTPLSTPEVFYLATKGGGRFFGNVGSFEKDYEFDALVIDDSILPNFKDLTLEERLQKFIYTGDDRNIVARYVSGKLVKEPKTI